MLRTENELEEYQSEMQEIISTPPPWLIRWGMTLFFSILVMLVGLSALIKYPDVIKTHLRINSENAPMPVVTKISGKIVQLLVNDNQHVNDGQNLAYIESTGNHNMILEILKQLKSAQKDVFKNKALSFKFVNTTETFELGELQVKYQSFYQAFLAYNASISEGLYLKNKGYLQKDLRDIISQRKYLESQKQLQQREYELARQEYEMHKKLFEQKVEAQMELNREEAKFLSKHYPLQQTEGALLDNNNNYSVKEKEIMELDNLISEGKTIFLQALNGFISEIENWKSNYILTASRAGKVRYSGIIQQQQFINTNHAVFYIDPESADFFGEMSIPQYNMGKVREGQVVLVKLKSYPFEEYGILRGNIKTIAQLPFKDSVFISKVSFSRNGLAGLKRNIKFKNGMLADAEIITDDASLLKRLTKNIIKIIE